MNFRNLAMWAVIVILTIGLYNMFKNPQGSVNQKNNIIFSEFLTQVDNGRVVQVEIQGKNIKGVMSNGEIFNTYAPDDPNLIQKLSEKGVSPDLYSMGPGSVRPLPGTLRKKRHSLPSLLSSPHTGEKGRLVLRPGWLGAKPRALEVAY